MDASKRKETTFEKVRWKRQNWWLKNSKTFSKARLNHCRRDKINMHFIFSVHKNNKFYALGAYIGASFQLLLPLILMALMVTSQQSLCWANFLLSRQLLSGYVCLYTSASVSTPFCMSGHRSQSPEKHRDSGKSLMTVGHLASPLFICVHLVLPIK